MQSDNTQRAMERVISYCKDIIQLKGRPSDEAIETSQKILRIIYQELNK